MNRRGARALSALPLKYAFGREQSCVAEPAVFNGLGLLEKRAQETFARNSVERQKRSCTISQNIPIIIDLHCKRTSCGGYA